MLKQPQLIRDRIIRHMHELRIQISQLPETEQKALTALGDADSMTEIVNLLLNRLGHAPSQAKDPRFDKTRRALAKKTPRLRGEPRLQEAM